MDIWNREELYHDIWREPMLTLSKKYGVSGVMLGRVCRRLSIPVPGRGYWARKAAGYRVGVRPLPTLKTVPVIQRYKMPDLDPPEPQPLPPEPTDSEYLKVLEIGALRIAVDANAPLHRLVSATAKAFKAAYKDAKGQRTVRGYHGVLSLRISEQALERASVIQNAVVLGLQSLGVPLKVDQGKKRVTTSIFGQDVGFEVVEKYRQIRIPQIERKNDSSDKFRYENNGILEVRVFNDRYGKCAIQDRKNNFLENQISLILAAFFNQARAAKIAEEEERQRKIKEREREIERYRLSEKIREEEKKVETLDEWVTNWSRARLYREFVSALEASWKLQDEGVPEGSERANRLNWMRQQADRLDPLVDSPPSILDRKREVSRY